MKQTSPQLNVMSKAMKVMSLHSNVHSLSPKPRLYTFSNLFIRDEFTGWFKAKYVLC